MYRFLMAALVAAFLVPPSFARAIDPGPPIVFAACKDLQAVHDFSEWMRIDPKNTRPSDYALQNCYNPRSRPSPISLEGAQEKLGPLEVVMCFRDADGDLAVVFFSGKARSYNYAFWFRVPDDEAVCASKEIGQPSDLLSGDTSAPTYTQINHPGSSVPVVLGCFDLEVVIELWSLPNDGWRDVFRAAEDDGKCFFRPGSPIPATPVAVVTTVTDPEGQTFAIVELEAGGVPIFVPYVDTPEQLRGRFGLNPAGYAA